MSKQSAAGVDMQIEYVALEDVTRWERNPKLHASDTIDKSIDRFGYVQPLMRDEGTGRLVAGHGRLQVLIDRKRRGEPPPGRIKVRKKDGAWLVPVIRGVGFTSEQEAEAYVIADNRLVELGGWDDKLLAEILGNMKIGSVSLDGVGFDEGTMEAILSAEAARNPNGVEFPAVDEADADARIKTVKCPHCGGEVPV